MQITLKLVEPLKTQAAHQNPFEVDEHATIAGIIADLKLDPSQAFFVSLNDKLVPKSAYTTSLKAADQLVIMPNITAG